MNKIFTIIFLLIATISYSQTFELDGQLRPRFEYKHGYKTLIDDKTDPGMAVSQRTRLNFKFEHNNLKTLISIQDVSIWGDQTTRSNRGSNGLMIHQAWAEYNFFDNFSIKLGRQELAYDNQRLLGRNDWSQGARRHDAFLLKYNPTEKLQFHGIAAFNQTNDADTGTFYTLNNYKTLQAIWAQYKLQDFSASLIFINDGKAFNKTDSLKTTQTTKYSQTVGPFIKYNKNNFEASSAAYYQFGKTEKNIEKSAWFFGGDIAYRISKVLKIGVGTQIISGADFNKIGSQNSKSPVFSLLYAGAHNCNGWMDYFYSSSPHGDVGLKDFYLPIFINYRKFEIQIQNHYYQSFGTIYNIENNEKMSSELGFEMGVMVTYPVSTNLQFLAGYSQIFPTASLQYIKGTGDRYFTQNWAWVSLNFQPKFFKITK